MFRLNQSIRLVFVCFLISMQHSEQKGKIRKDLLVWSHDNVSEWSDMYFCRLLFYWASTIKIQLNVFWRTDIIISSKGQSGSWCIFWCMFVSYSSTQLKEKWNCDVFIIPFGERYISIYDNNNFPFFFQSLKGYILYINICNVWQNTVQ